MTQSNDAAADHEGTSLVHSRTEVRRGRVLQIGYEDVTLPTGVRATLDVLKHPGASCVLPIIDDGARQGVVLIRQFRHCAKGWLWEAPAGTLNDGEDPHTCAVRELQEEAGLVADRLTHVGSILTAPGFTDERIHLWLAEGTGAAPMARDVDEVITQVKLFSWDDVVAMVTDGRIEDAKTSAVLLQAILRRRR